MKMNVNENHNYLDEEMPIRQRYQPSVKEEDSEEEEKVSNFSKGFRSTIYKNIQKVRTEQRDKHGFSLPKFKHEQPVRANADDCEITVESVPDSEILPQKS